VLEPVSEVVDRTRGPFSGRASLSEELKRERAEGKMVTYVPESSANLRYLDNEIGADRFLKSSSLTGRAHVRPLTICALPCPSPGDVIFIPSVELFLHLDLAIPD
jgi:hypothetical protein